MLAGWLAGALALIRRFFVDPNHSLAFFPPRSREKEAKLFCPGYVFLQPRLFLLSLVIHQRKSAENSRVTLGPNLRHTFRFFRPISSVQSHVSFMSLYGVEKWMNRTALKKFGLPLFHSLCCWAGLQKLWCHETWEKFISRLKMEGSRDWYDGELSIQSRKCLRLVTTASRK